MLYVVPQRKKMKVRIIEEIKYIDKEKDIIDFGTGDVISDNIFDTKTHVPYYDSLISDKEYAKKHNLQTKIEQMSPNEYFDICGTVIFPNSSPEKLKQQRARDKVVNDEIYDLIVKYKKKVFLPYINYAEQTQEGLHRMYVAGEIFGWNHKFPVLIIDYLDKDLAASEEKDKIENSIKNNITKAVNKALEYKYSSIDEFLEQLKWEIDRQFNEENTNFEFEEIGNNFEISVFSTELDKDVTEKFSKNDIKFDTDIDWDNIIDEIDFDDIV